MSVADETLSVGGPPVRRWSTRWLGPFAVGLALLSALLTFLVLTGLTGVIPTHEVVVAVLLGNLLATGFLLAVIGWEVWRVIQAKRKGRAGSRLHIRIVALFSVIAAVPAVLVAIVASITLDRGLDRWFSQRTRAVIENSITVAQGYLQEHAQTIRGDIMAMANDIGRAKPLFDTERDRFKQFLTAQASVRGLPGALLIDKEGNILERADLRIGREFAPPPANVISEVNETQPQVAVIPDENYVAAIIQLRNFDSTYLYVARLLDPRIVQQVKEARESVAEYATFETRRLGVQVAFGLMYTVIALIVLLSAVWIGLNFATRLVAPIRRLIGAADAVSGGNLYVHVPVHRSEGDLAQLGDTFNKMIAELRSQRDDLIGARDVIDSRRRFTEAVLSGASAGIVGVDPEGQISILNRSAQKLIDSAEEDVIGRPLSECIPELAPLLKEAQTGSQRLVHGQVTISRNGRERNVSVRVTSEQTAQAQHGYVLTLDDITDLVQAQRSSAWADIARRIAHEIKNPLTPIQLSAERLRRKFGRHITEDRAVFDQCTDTIVRQVDDIRRMVDEFSKFARMPKAVIADEDLADTVRQVAFLMRVGHPEIDIEVAFAEDKMPVRFDRRLIAQALTNLIKNAAEAIAAVPPNESKGRGKIKINTARDNSGVVIDIIDNGVGLPKENRNRLLEPYFTTREKGTGLGLAIVGRILEEHGGRLELMDSPEVSQGGRGAWVRARFAVEDDDNDQDQSTPDDARKSAVASER